MGIDTINIRRLIPLAVGSAILALGCSQESSIARNYCKTWKDCNEDTFEDEFDSVGDCAKVYGKYAEAQAVSYKVRESAECVKAYRESQKCESDKLTCDAFPDTYEDYGDLTASERDKLEKQYDDYTDWREDVRDDCEDELDDFVDECFDDDDSSSYNYSSYYY